jgi:hypothetical protein
MLENIKGDATGQNHAIHILKCNKPNDDPILIVIIIKSLSLKFLREEAINAMPGSPISQSQDATHKFSTTIINFF